MWAWALDIVLGMVGGALFYAPLARKVWNLQCDLSTTQAQLLKLKNAGAATTRWKDKETLEGLMQAAKPTVTAVPRNPLNKFGING